MSNSANKFSEDEDYTRYDAACSALGFIPESTASYPESTAKTLEGGLLKALTIANQFDEDMAKRIVASLGFFSAYQAVEPQTHILKWMSEIFIQEYFEGYVCCIVDYCLHHDRGSKVDDYDINKKQYELELSELKQLISSPASIKSKNLKEPRYHVFDD